MSYKTFFCIIPLVFFASWHSASDIVLSMTSPVDTGEQHKKHHMVNFDQSDLIGNVSQLQNS